MRAAWARLRISSLSTPRSIQIVSLDGGPTSKVQEVPSELNGEATNGQGLQTGIVRVGVQGDRQREQRLADPRAAVAGPANTLRPSSASRALAVQYM